MGLPVEQQAKYWSIVTAVLFIILWFLGDVILPFVLGGALAYCLDPIADRLQKMGLSRIASTIVITLVALVIFTVLILLVVPTLIQQTSALIRSAPEIFNNLQTFLAERFPSIMVEDSTIRQQLLKIGEAIESRGAELLNTVVTSAAGLVNILVLVVIVPVVTFYLLLDWDNMTAKIDDLLPRDHAPTVRHLAKEIDKTLASFIRGQGTVCLILGTYYAVALMIIGLNFGLVVGFIAGLISFIPYVGAVVGGGLALGLGIFQFWGEWYMLAAVAAVFFSGQMVEGNILTPNLVGSSVGLHPVWLIFALSVFGSLFGFVGMLVAVPVAAMIGVIARFAISRYKDGRLYNGLSGQQEPNTDD
ncbi:AI-2E family transporter [Cognatishimia sp. MH4019]|uniref:AI-2E family transporter n=1 Tax=Cognatishimia sp. MH4019 TaxID=2854030 RepID=UPI001CD4573C|nr:AI-2E family transporter [Cognatishimia sp. MH4019]